MEVDYQYVESLQSFKPTDYSQFQGENPGQDDITYEEDLGPKRPEINDIVDTLVEEDLAPLPEDVDAGKGRRGGKMAKRRGRKMAKRKTYRAMTGWSVLTQYGLYGTVPGQ